MKGNVLDTEIMVGDKTIMWGGFLFVVVMIISSICRPFTDVDTANMIAWCVAPVIVFICAIHKTVRAYALPICIMLLYIIGGICFLSLLCDIGEIYGKVFSR